MTENQGISSAIEQGQATSEQMQAASKFIQVKMASDLLGNQGKFIGTLANSFELLDRLNARISQQINTSLDEDTLSIEDAITYSHEIHARVLSVLELQRKIAQGKNLLEAMPTLNEEEKVYLQMLKSFKTEEAKRKFVETLKASISAPEQEQQPETFD